jgi:hypothetical protein
MSEQPLIEQLQVSEEEKQISFDKVRNLFRVDKAKAITKTNIDRFFEEWKVIAKRINTGTKMLDKAESQPEGANTAQYVRELNDLYVLQLKLLGIYESLFKKWLTNEQYYRAYDQIMQILQA